MKLHWPGSVAAAVTVGGTLRLALWAAALCRTGTSGMTSGDTASYLEPGQNLLFLGRFATAGLAEIDRTPGYPLFLAACWSFGPAFAALLQVGLSAASIYLVARLARASFQNADRQDARNVRLAAWFFALEPVSIVYSVRLLSETLFLFVLLLALERIFVFCRTRQLQTLALGGFWLAAAAFIRPIGYYLPFIFSLVLLVFLPAGWRMRWRSAAVLLLCVLPWLLAWQARNWVETGYAGFSSIGVRNAYFYSAAEVQAKADGLTLGEEQRRMGYGDEAAYRAAHPGQRDWNQVQRLAFQKSETLRILHAHPWSLIRTQMVGSAVVAFTPCAADLYRLLGSGAEDAPVRIVHEGIAASILHLAREHPALAAGMVLLEVWLLALYAMALAGLASRTVALPASALALGLVAWFLIASGGVQAVGRYRLPIMPVVCVLAAAKQRAEDREQETSESTSETGFSDLGTLHRELRTTLCSLLSVLCITPTRLA
ncbi:hypothetical protein ACOBR2_10310 [Telmatobacter bradus]|uniref:hypothetical protein n=1 Tax=Telmatobacter bradus TaxID=474953 RepID=UPI003B42D44D